MPSYCSVYGCSCSSSKNQDLSFFLYPLKNEKLLKAWIARVRREGFTPTSTSYVCSRHFNESDLYVPKSDTPSAFKKRRLWKGAMPSVNLRGREEDERVEKRVSSYLPRKVIDSGETATASNAPEPLLDDVSMFEDTPSDLNTNYRVDDLLERISLLEKKRFLYGNLTDTDVKNYTGIAHSIFKVIVQTLEDFALLNY